MATTTPFSWRGHRPVRRWFAAALLAIFAGTPLAGDPPEAAAAIRYADNHDGTVLDRKTGLLWLRDAACRQLGPTADGRGTFDEAKAAAANLRSGLCGLSDGSKPGDWRLPTEGEWQAMLAPAYKNPALDNSDGTGKWHSGDPFVNVRGAGYWSSTTDSEASSYAWGAGLFSGVVASARKGEDHYIWPVRRPGPAAQP